MMMMMMMGAQNYSLFSRHFERMLMLLMVGVWVDSHFDQCLTHDPVGVYPPLESSAHPTPDPTNFPPPDRGERRHGGEETSTKAGVRFDGARAETGAVVRGFWLGGADQGFGAGTQGRGALGVGRRLEH